MENKTNAIYCRLCSTHTLYENDIPEFCIVCGNVYDLQNAYRNLVMAFRQLARPVMVDQAIDNDVIDKATMGKLLHDIGNDIFKLSCCCVKLGDK